MGNPFGGIFCNWGSLAIFLFLILILLVGGIDH